jgi:prepilin-type N-terminal cleavage/methylation domain-containing protein
MRHKLKQQPGFTLIELLIVIVIIGILAAIAMPKLGKVRERGYFKAVMSDLRNLQTQQEIYYNPQFQLYASTLPDLPNYRNSPGVTVVITEAGNTGWAATGSHAALDAAQTCAVYFGTVTSVPAPASTPGIVTCTGE